MKHTAFSELGIIPDILKVLEQEGYTQPTPIQESVIPFILKRHDVLGCAQTGTGKTAAFALPILQLLSQKIGGKENRKIRSLILTPTRELAIQINESIQIYGKLTRLTAMAIYGGVGQKVQTDTLQKGLDILIATPGRLLDLFQQGYVNLRDVEIFVLDEADRMLDMGFVHDVRRILKLLPEKRQSLFFSATMPPEITKLADSILVNPEKIEVTPVSSTAETINQFLYFVDKNNKNLLLLELLKNKAIKTVLVFTRTKHGADKVVKFLQKYKVTAEAIHGNKSQNNRQRALANFKNQTTRVLVATDIAARGIDIDDLEYVINYEIPNIAETYVHRIGRTGRAGANGTAYSFCDIEEKAYLIDIEKLIGKRISVIDNHPFPMEVFIVEPKPQRVARPPRKYKPQNERKERNSNIKKDWRN